MAGDELPERVVDLLERLGPNLIFTGSETGVCPSNRSDANRNAEGVLLDITLPLADF
jgi:hypothetical protein